MPETTVPRPYRKAYVYATVFRPKDFCMPSVLLEKIESQPTVQVTYFASISEGVRIHATAFRSYGLHGLDES